MIKDKKNNETSLLSFYNKIEISQKYSFSQWSDYRSKCDILETYIICPVETPETCEDQIEWW